MCRSLQDREAVVTSDQSLGGFEATTKSERDQVSQYHRPVSNVTNQDTGDRSSPCAYPTRMYCHRFDAGWLWPGSTARNCGSHDFESYFSERLGLPPAGMLD